MNKKCYYMWDDVELKLFDEDGNDNEFTSEGVDLEDSPEWGHKGFIPLMKKAMKELRQKHPDVEFIDIDD